MTSGDSGRSSTASDESDLLWLSLVRETPLFSPLQGLIYQTCGGWEHYSLTQSLWNAAACSCPDRLLKWQS